jgi:hypothetical protein
MIRCPNCGGDVPKLGGDRSKRLGCPYCGAVSDIATQQVVAQQEAAMKAPDIPIGSHGKFDETSYVCIAYVRRGTDYDGDYYSWEEYLIWAEQIGYRWLVKDPESGWSWAVPVNVADLNLSEGSDSVVWGERRFRIRNRGTARVDYVLGEVYWQAAIGETTRTADFVDNNDVLSREEAPGEVKWSYSTPVPWAVIAQAFNLPVDGPGGHMAPMMSSGSGSASSGSGCGSTVMLLIIIGIVLVFCMLGSIGDDDSTYRGGGGGVIIFGGK